MNRALQWLKTASRTNRTFRTLVQGVGSYLVISIPVFWDGGGDLMLAIRALLIGAIAAGISAIWKTAEDDLKASQQGK